ncbi:hypothetical protein Bca101_091702 [Brassica carinata]
MGTTLQRKWAVVDSQKKVLAKQVTSGTESRWKRVVLLVFIYMFGQTVLVKGDMKKELIDIVCR